METFDLKAAGRDVLRNAQYWREGAAELRESESSIPRGQTAFGVRNPQDRADELKRAAGHAESAGRALLAR